MIPPAASVTISSKSLSVFVQFRSTGFFYRLTWLLYCSTWLLYCSIGFLHCSIGFLHRPIWFLHRSTWGSFIVQPDSFIVQSGSFIVQPDLQSGCLFIFRQIANLPVRKSAGTKRPVAIPSGLLSRPLTPDFLLYRDNSLEFIPFIPSNLN